MPEYDVSKERPKVRPVTGAKEYKKGAVRRCGWNLSGATAPSGELRRKTTTTTKRKNAYKGLGNEKEIFRVISGRPLVRLAPNLTKDFRVAYPVVAAADPL